MSQTLHTPGPWQVIFQYGQTVFICTKNGGDDPAIAEVVTPRAKLNAGERPEERRDANAHLLAAAPELLAALVSAMTAIPNPDDVDDRRADSLDEYDKMWSREMHRVAAAAIAKAQP